MAKTPRRRVPARQEAAVTAAQAAAASRASSTSGDERRSSSSAGSPLSGPRPSSRRRGPFSWFGKLQPRFAADVISELRKVTWPTFNDTRYLTFVVAVVAVLVGLILGAFDLAFGWVIERLFFD